MKKVVIVFVCMVWVRTFQKWPYVSKCLIFPYNTHTYLCWIVPRNCITKLQSKQTKSKNSYKKTPTCNGNTHKKLHTSAGLPFYVRYIHSITISIVPMERVQHTIPTNTNTQIAKHRHFCFRNNATIVRPHKQQVNSFFNSPIVFVQHVFSNYFLTLTGRYIDTNNAFRYFSWLET